ncbi:cytochrome c2 [Ketogulonicigenium robustum]|uniref:Cytochrome c2 n=1 Tax=Ketogulonicigenium robustum TaxID=92947 RepID=A0A1W6NXF1_9RHOB|nr:c-type cytochrome [Ketogulonicigenium robustum]ARO13687.1 cytochrome c2 [Ketogulonicigenium robustum]
MVLLSHLKRRIGAAVLAFGALLGAPAIAVAGDAQAGERSFARQCTACHVIRDDSGSIIMGTGARTGPNLFGLASRPAATADGFAYGPSMQQLAGRAVGWDENAFVSFVTAPSAFLQQRLGDRRASSRMAYLVRNPADAADIWAYLSRFSN